MPKTSLPKRRQSGYVLGANDDWNPVVDAIRSSRIGGKRGARSLDHFMCRIISEGPAAESDYVDERYWIQRIGLSDMGCDDTHTLSDMGIDWGIPASDYIYTATNLYEINNRTHYLPSDLYVEVFKMYDTSSDSTAHYYFWKTVATSLNYAQVSDLKAFDDGVYDGFETEEDFVAWVTAFPCNEIGENVNSDTTLSIKVATFSGMHVGYTESGLVASCVITYTSADNDVDYDGYIVHAVTGGGIVQPYLDVKIW